MKIGILGAGRIGATVAALLATAGHKVLLSNSKGIISPGSPAQNADSNRTDHGPEAAIEFGSVIVIAVPWSKRDRLPAPDLLADKILVDAMNAYSADSKLVPLGDSTSSEETQRQFPKALVVKAFNTLYWETLATRGTRHAAHRLTLPLSADDATAVETVFGLISDAGFAPFRLGPLRMGKLQEPGGPFYNKTLTLKESKDLFEAVLNA